MKEFCAQRGGAREGVGSAPRFFSTPFRTLLKKEVFRFLSVYNQTLITPLISATLYLLIFGVALGKDLPSPYPGISYIQFLVPGLMMMALMNNAFQNTSSSLFISKYLGNIVDVLVAPLRFSEIVLAYMLGGVARGMLVGLSVAVISRLFTHFWPVHPFYSLLFCFLAGSIFALLGMIAAIWADRFDDLSIFNTYLILPLMYLGGIFYSVEILPPFFRALSFINPMLYMINGLRFGLLGRADTSPTLSFALLLAFFAFFFSLALWIVKTGYKLRT